MAEGETVPDVTELTERLSKMRASDTPEQTQQTSFIDDNSQYNIGDNLDDVPIFATAETQEKESRYITNLDSLITAMGESKSKWKYTKEGLQQLSSRVHLDGRNIYYEPKTELGPNEIKKIKGKDKKIVFEKKMKIIKQRSIYV